MEQVQLGNRGLNTSSKQHPCLPHPPRNGICYLAYPSSRLTPFYTKENLSTVTNMEVRDSQPLRGTTSMRHSQVPATKHFWHFPTRRVMQVMCPDPPHILSAPRCPIHLPMPSWWPAPKVKILSKPQQGILRYKNEAVSGSGQFSFSLISWMTVGGLPCFFDLSGETF